VSVKGFLAMREVWHEKQLLATVNRARMAVKAVENTAGRARCSDRTQPMTTRKVRFPMAQINLVRLLFQSQFPCKKKFRNHSRSRARVLGDGREILSGAAYERRRREVLKRDDYRCVSCGSKFDVSVHHRCKRSLGRDDRTENLITLCLNCHAEQHGGAL
jgi:5-methylcytosine-specific restriction endonuclease McrA